MHKRDTQHGDDQFRILRRQFRIRSAQKKEKELEANQSTQQLTTSKTKTRKAPAKKKAKQLSTTSTTSITTKTTASSDSQSPIPKNEEEAPTEFEKVANPRPAIFARDWHKWETPLDRLPGNKKKTSKNKTKRKSQRKKTREHNRTADGGIVHTPSEEERKMQKNQKNEDYSTLTGTSAKVIAKKRPISKTKEDKKELEENAKREKRLGKKLPGSPLIPEKHKIVKNDSAESKNDKVLAAPVDQTGARKSAETVLKCDSPPLMSFDDEHNPAEANVTTPVALVPVTDEPEIMKLKPVSSPVESNSVAQQPEPEMVFHKEDEVTAQDWEDKQDAGNSARVVMKQASTMDLGNSNFSLVEASSKIIDYCLEKEIFKQVLDSDDFQLFNEFFSGRKDCNERILVMLDSLLDQVLDNKKLAESEQLSAAMVQLNKDKIEAKNNLLDALISKKAVPKANDKKPKSPPKERDSDEKKTEAGGSTTISDMNATFDAENEEGDKNPEQ